MRKLSLQQEGLKLIACITMLLDHIGAVIVLDCFYQATGENKDALLDIYEILRMIGRLAFPIYCFLLVEGFVHTRNVKCYAVRLMVAAALSEIPYDMALYGEITWQHQSVVVTLLLGCLMLEVMKRSQKTVRKLLAITLFAALNACTNADYGTDGILVIALFALTRELPRKGLLQCIGLWCIFSPNHLMMLNWLGKFSVTTQELAVLAIIPILLYDGRKITNNKAVQWAFYLFYPVHLMVLYFIGRV